MCNIVLVSVRKPNSSVNTVTRERAAYPRNVCSIRGRGKSVILLPAASGPFQWVPRAISPEVKRSEREGNN